jgi:Cu-Zn family superoxide dismutase
MTGRLAYSLLACLLTVAGCTGYGPRGAGGMHHDGPTARATLEPTRGNATTGVVVFHQQGEGVLIHAMVSGLKPNQEHGFHVHEKGDCSSGDGLSAGGHFNPTGMPHGPQDAAHHAGDLPSLKADANGNTNVHLFVRGLAVGSGATDVVGRGLIVHAQPDDFRTQPTGNAGARLACAVIVRAY